MAFGEVAFDLTIGELEDVDHEKPISEDDAVVAGGSDAGWTEELDAVVGCVEEDNTQSVGS